jgi:hypothetical protein
MEVTKMRNTRFANSLIVMAFAIVALVIGCNDINGGGWIEKSNGKKANFGFNFKCKCEGEGLGNAEASGQLQFHDREKWNDFEKGVKFHGVVDSVPQNTCGGLASKFEGQYSGSYTPQLSGSYTPQPRKLGKLGKLDKGGRFTIYLKDNGESGPTKGDFFKLTLTGGIYDGYELEGTLEGGNIQTPGA